MTSRWQAQRSQKRVDPFYRSCSWARLRNAVLRAQGRRCSVCGTTEGQMHVDHIISRKTRPDLALAAENCVVLCHACHSHKTARHDGGFGNRQRAGPVGCDADGNPEGGREGW